MALRRSSLLFWTLCVLSIADGCASTETSTAASASYQPAQPHHRRRRRRRRRRRPPPEALAAAPAVSAAERSVPGEAPVPTSPAATFGTPLAAVSADVVTPRWEPRGSHGRIVCQGAERLPHPQCPQCPDAPDAPTIERAFALAERRVLQCEPPADARGMLNVRALMIGAGVPLELEFLGVTVDENVANCMAPALCNVRTPHFRNGQTIVDHAYVVMTPGGE